MFHTNILIHSFRRKTQESQKTMNNKLKIKIKDCFQYRQDQYRWKRQYVKILGSAWEPWKTQGYRFRSKQRYL